MHVWVTYFCGVSVFGIDDRLSKMYPQVHKEEIQIVALFVSYEFQIYDFINITNFIHNVFCKCNQNFILEISEISIGEKRAKNGSDEAQHGKEVVPYC